MFLERVISFTHSSSAPIIKVDSSLTLSGIIGSIFGILIAEIGVRLIGTDGFSLVYTPGTFILAFGITIIVGIIGGVYPAYKASKLAPTEALRYE